MLFNSYPFLFVFLPVTLIVFFITGGFRGRLGAVWLTAASLFFYGWWSPVYVGLLMGSVLFNYAVGLALAKGEGHSSQKVNNSILLFGVAANLALLTYYKYANFFLSNLNSLFGTAWDAGKILLPLGISFFTFTQIAFLVDAYRGKAREYNFVHYSLFVTYFPHLIAGPILHHKEIMPQFSRTASSKFSFENIAIGLTVFSIGLFKKVILADTIAPYANIVFETAAKGQTLSFLESWAGGIFYALQLYFDFSGYSDMAIGLSQLIGVKLPLNFYSPYQAVNIIEFWKRWHITLSRFLKDYLYIPLGGNRRGNTRRFINLMITMLLGGLWHGAAWTFVIWGALHGLYVIINHTWHLLRRALRYDKESSGRWGKELARTLTFLAVVVAWVFFRADTVAAAVSILRGMAGRNGLVLPEAWLLYSGGLGHWLAGHGIMFGSTPAFPNALREPVLLAGLIGIVWYLPNSQQIMGKFRPALETYRGDKGQGWKWLQWRPGWMWAVCSAFLMAISIVMIDQVSEFLYFQF